MIARQAQKTALIATLIAVLLMLYAHVDHYIRHMPE
jgi:hypothetical protein